jgi:DNA-binding SARP family transcriptional activator
MEIRVLGRVDVTDGAHTTPLGATREGAVLALLVIHAGEVVSTDRLVEALWGDDQPPGAYRTLHTYVAKLRRILAPSRVAWGRMQAGVITRRPGYVLELPTEAIDAARFEEHVTAGRATSDPLLRSSMLATALSWWAGPAYGPFADEPWARADAARLEELRLTALEQRIDADLEAGRHGALIPELQLLVDRNPYRERLWAQLMLCLYGTGRQADALRTYQRVRETLAADLGIAPSTSLRDLERAILAQDRTLDLIPGHAAEHAADHAPDHVPDRAPDRPSLIEVPPDGPSTGADDRELVVAPFAVDALDDWADPAHLHARAVAIDAQPSLPSLPTDVFVGRRRELDVLRARFESVRGGRPEIVTVEGPAGNGKSRLVREFCLPIEDLDATVAWGVCTEGDDRPYAPWIQALQPHLRPGGGGGPDPTSGDRAVVEAALSGDLAREAVGPVDELSDRHRLFAAITRLVAGIAHDRPLVLVIDDLHWADRPSLDLLRHVALSLGSHPSRPTAVLLCAITRSPPLEAADALGAMRRDGGATSIGVGGLDVYEISDYLHRIGIHTGGHELADLLGRHTQGNPLLLEQVCRVVATAQPVTASSVRAMIDSALLPADLEHAITARLRDLDGTSFDLVTWLAVLGGRSRPGSLARAMGCEPVDVKPSIDTCIAQGVLERRDERVVFSHPLYQHAVLTALAAHERRERHRHIAHMILERPATGTHAWVALHHLVEAGHAADAESIRSIAPAAAEWANSVSAWGEEARCWEAAVDATDEGPELGAWHLRAGLARKRNMDPDAALEHFRLAAQHSEAQGDPVGLARALLGRTRCLVGQGRSAGELPIAELRATIARLDDVPGLQAAALAELAQALWIAGRFGDSTAAAAEAAVRARRVDAHDAAALAHLSRGTVQWIRLDLVGAERSLGAARRRAVLGDDPLLEFAALDRLALHLVWTGRFADARSVLARASELGQQRNMWFERSMLLSALVTIEGACGDFAGAGRHAHEAALAARLTGYRWADMFYFPAQAWTLACSGDQAGADRVLDEWEGADGRASPIVANLVWLARLQLRARSGDLDEVREQIRRRWQLVTSNTPVSAGTTSWFAVLAELAWLTDDARLAAHAHMALTEIRGRGVVVTSATVALVDRVTGLAAAALGEVDEAVARLRAAVRTAQELGAWAEVAQASLDLGDVLPAGGAAARAAVTRGERTADDLGMVALRRSPTTPGRHTSISQQSSGSVR